MSFLLNPYRYQAAGGSFDPLTLTPFLYFDPRQGTYVDAGSTLATNGQTVQQWNDQSGNGRNASEANASKRPTLATSGSDAELQYDTSDDILSTASQTFAGSGATLCAWIKPSSIDPSTISNVLGFEAGGINLCQIRLDSSSMKPNFNIYLGGQVSPIGATGLTSGAWSFLAGVYNGSTAQVYVNNVSQASAAASGSFNITGAIGVGHSTSFGRRFRGSMGRMYMFNYALNSTQLTDLYNFGR